MVFLNQGIAINSWIAIDGTCPVSCDVVGDEAQFELGTGEGWLNIHANEAALERLAQVFAEALRRWQEVPEGEEVNFTVKA